MRGAIDRGRLGRWEQQEDAARDDEASAETRATKEAAARSKFRAQKDKGHGVLQRFIKPFGGHNAVLRTQRTPHHFTPRRISC